MKYKFSCAWGYLICNSEPRLFGTEARIKDAKADKVQQEGDYDDDDDVYDDVYDDDEIAVAGLWKVSVLPKNHCSL